MVGWRGERGNKEKKRSKQNTKEDKKSLEKGEVHMMEWEVKWEEFIKLKKQT